eukprot:s2910_g4.t1
MYGDLIHTQYRSLVKLRLHHRFTHAKELQRVPKSAKERVRLQKHCFGRVPALVPGVLWGPGRSMAQASYQGVVSHGHNFKSLEPPVLQVPKAVPLPREGSEVVKSVQVETFRRVQGPNPPVYSYQPAGWYTSRAAQPVYANWQRSPPSAQRPTLVEHRVQGAVLQSPSLRPPVTPVTQVREPKATQPGCLSREERAAQLLASIFQRPPSDEPTWVHPAPAEPAQLSHMGRSAPLLQGLPGKPVQVLQAQIPPASPAYSARLTQNDRTMTRTTSYQPLWTPPEAYVSTPPTRLPSAPETSSTPSVQGGPPYRRPEVSLEATAPMCGASIGDLEATRKQDLSL